MLKKLVNKIRGEHDTETLIKRGLIVGRNFHRQQQVIIDPDHCHLIRIGNSVTLAPRVHILAHDASTKIFIGKTKVAPVKIGDSVFVGAGAIILPNVTIGDNVIIGAGSVVTSDIPSDSVAAGNPAKVICSLQEFLGKRRNEAEKYGSKMYID